MKCFILTFTFILTSSFAIWNGKLASEAMFPATIYLESCGGVRVGPRSFLTAAHCVVGDDDLGENQKRYIEEQYREGMKLKINHGLNSKNQFKDDTVYEIIIEKTIVAASYLRATKKNQHALDLALIISRENSFPQIAIADIAHKEIEEGMAVVLNGYGLRDLSTIERERLFNHSLSGEGLRSVNADSQLLPQQYSFVPKIGYSKGMFILRSDVPYILRNESSPPVISSGDSGGPLWILDSKQGPFLRLVGINSSANTLSHTSHITALNNNEEFQVFDWLEQNIK